MPEEIEASRGDRERSNQSSVGRAHREPGSQEDTAGGQYDVRPVSGRRLDEDTRTQRLGVESSLVWTPIPGNDHVAPHTVPTVRLPIVEDESIPARPVSLNRTAATTELIDRLVEANAIRREHGERIANFGTIRGNNDTDPPEGASVYNRMAGVHIGYVVRSYDNIFGARVTRVSRPGPLPHLEDHLHSSLIWDIPAADYPVPPVIDMSDRVNAAYSGLNREAKCKKHILNEVEEVKVDGMQADLPCSFCGKNWCECVLPPPTSNPCREVSIPQAEIIRYPNELVFRNDPEAGRAGAEFARQRFFSPSAFTTGIVGLPGPIGPPGGADARLREVLDGYAGRVHPLAPDGDGDELADQ